MSVNQPGAFIQVSDVGNIKQKGSTTFDAWTGTYRIVANGDDLWAAKRATRCLSR